MNNPLLYCGPATFTLQGIDFKSIKSNKAVMTSKGQETEPLIFNKSQHPLSAQSVDPDAIKIIRRLSRHGHEAYIVGGGVRDLLLDKTPKDFDIATDATPRQIKALFRNCRIIGRRFKLAHIYFRGNKIIEVSTFRDEHDTNPDDEDQELLIKRDNVYGSVMTDAVRRDLTINGLFYDPLDQVIVDYVGGMQDLDDGVIRIIGEPAVRIAEDPVRMIRAIRHAARAGFSMDSECATAISENHDLISQCPTMRLYEELKKDFCSGHIVTILQLLREYALLDHFLPFFSSEPHINLFEPGNFFLDTLSRADTAARENKAEIITPVLAIFVLFFKFPSLTLEEFIELRLTQQELKEDADQAFEHLAVPRKEKERIVLLIKEVHSVLRENAGIGKSRKKRSSNRSDLLYDRQYLLYFLGFGDYDLPQKGAPTKSSSRRRRDKKQVPPKRTRRN